MNFGGEKKPININNFAGLSRKWVGVKLFMCLPFSWEKTKTHKQNSQEILGKGRESPGTVPGYNPVKILFMCFLVYWFFLGPRTDLSLVWFARASPDSRFLGQGFVNKL